MNFAAISQQCRHTVLIAERVFGGGRDGTDGTQLLATELPPGSAVFSFGHIISTFSETGSDY